MKADREIRAAEKVLRALAQCPAIKPGTKTVRCILVVGHVGAHMHPSANLKVEDWKWG